MDTERFKNKGDKSRGGKNNTKTILTSAGTAVFGGVAGVMAAGSGKEDHEDKQEDDEKKGAIAQDDKSQEQNTDENSQNTKEAQNQTSDLLADENGSNPTQPQPTDSNAQQAGNGHNQSIGQQEPQHESPEEIAQNLLKDDVDPNDIDLPDAISVQSFTTVMDEDGNELQAAIVSSPDGGNFLIIDDNDDGNFNVIATTDGNYVAEVETRLTHDDLEAMLNSGGGYLALNSQDKPADVEPGPGDIVDTENPDEPYLAQRSTEQLEEGNEENSSSPIDDIIAQLIGDDDDEDDVIVDEDDTSDSGDDYLAENDEDEDSGSEDDSDADSDEEDYDNSEA